MTLTHTKKKILLAEDDGDDRDFFADFLGDRTDIELLPSLTTGVEVIEYLDGISLPELLPDIIILDQNMPKMTGLETLVAIRSDERFSPINVVIYSTYVGEELAVACLEQGGTLVKSKPVSKGGYNEMMDDILKVCKSISVG
ncbi:response regulator [Larkinella terrae]|uniref:Response regulator n=1 Tax=Larkinella terrae TaxID=2025311 RepID=A0A7K0EVB4_9BACT|nr:response regulator [Larkinella terrae]MRS65712.1 response regulator [Larkinella terrae]